MTKFKRRTRKKRGGEINPFMFKSTHNAQMEKMQIQIDDRDKQIKDIMNEALREIDLKKGVMKDLSEEQKNHLKDNVHNKLAKATLKLQEQSAEKFKDALLQDLKEKAGELKASEEKLQNCDQIKEGLDQALDDLQQQYKTLGEQSVDDMEEITDLKRKLEIKNDLLERYKKKATLRSNVLDNISRKRKCPAYSNVQNDTEVDYQVRLEAKRDCQKKGCKICDSECSRPDDCDTDEDYEGGRRRTRRRKSRKRKSKKKRRRKSKRKRKSRRKRKRTRRRRR